MDWQATDTLTQMTGCISQEAESSFQEEKLTQRQQVFWGIDVNHGMKMLEILFLSLWEDVWKEHKISSWHRGHAEAAELLSEGAKT